MKNKLKLLGIIALAAVIGFSVISCPEPEGDGFSGDKSLNGTWEDEWGVIKFNDGNWERPFEYKGTYTTNNNKITIKITHIHGNLFEGENEFGYVFASIWYTKTDLLNIAKNELGSNFNSVKEEIESELNEMFSESPAMDYYVDGNTLILAGDTYTKGSGEKEKDASIVGTWVMEMNHRQLAEMVIDSELLPGITVAQVEAMLQTYNVPSKLTVARLVFTEDHVASYSIINIDEIFLGGGLDMEEDFVKAYMMDGNDVIVDFGYGGYGDGYEYFGTISGNKLNVYYGGSYTKQ